MASLHSEQVEALRISVERLCQIAATQDVEKLGVERQAIERALEALTNEADTLRSERDDARTEASRAEFHLTATRELLEEGRTGTSSPMARASSCTPTGRHNACSASRCASSFVSRSPCSS